MTFSTEWNIRYKKNTHMSIWPWVELISHFMKFYDPKKSKVNILELGCGAGANIPFFLSLKTEYFGIDGSKIIIKNLMKRFPNIKNNLVAIDFTKEIPFERKFDFIIDRSAITHNPTNEIKNIMDLVHQKLSKNGIYIGIDWFSTKNSEYKNGVKTTDPFTKNNFKTGPFKKVGNVHFSNKKHLLNIFEKFKIEVLEEKTTKRKIPNDNKIAATWNIIAKKK
jgi:SAM-dependent methyltransferase